MADAPLRPAASLPTQIGRYRIVERIGRGAMGVVYSAQDEVIGRPVALKVLMADLESDPETRARFYREAQAAARLLHPNVITVFDAGEDQGRSFIAMQLLEGAPLGEYLRRGDAPPVERKLDLMIQICEGLSAAHSQGIVHRDLKPNNLFVQSDGLLKILDFGVARIADSSMTAAGAMLGTPDYMAPEQARGTTVDARSDIFSTGAVFYFMLAGRKPFPGPDLPSVLRQLQFDEPAPLPPNAAPPELVAIVMHAMAKDPAHRPARVEELLAALVRFRRQYQAETRKLVLGARSRHESVRGLLAAAGDARAALGIDGPLDRVTLLQELEDRFPPLTSSATGFEGGFERGRIVPVVKELDELHGQLASDVEQLQGALRALDAGEQALAAGDARAALRSFESAAVAYPDSPRARELADACRSLASEQQAREDRVAELAAQARTALDGRQWQAAIAAAREALTLVPGDEGLVALVGEAERAIAHEERRVALALQRLVERAERAIDQHHFEEAESALRELDAVHPDASAISEVRERLAEQRAIVEAAEVRRQLSAEEIRVARSAFRRGRYEQAIQQLRAFLEVEPAAQEVGRELERLQTLYRDMTSTAAAAESRARELLRQAAPLASRRAFAEALPLVREALRVWPADRDAAALLDAMLAQELEQRVALERKRDADVRATLADPLLATARQAIEDGYLGIALDAAQAAERVAPGRSDITDLLHQLRTELASEDPRTYELSGPPRRPVDPPAAPIAPPPAAPAALTPGPTPAPQPAADGVLAQVNHWAADLLRRWPAKG